MFFLLSGEGATDLGQSKGDAEISAGDDYEHGPMAILVSQIVESHDNYSPLESQVFGFISKIQIKKKAQFLKAAKKSLRIRGRKQPIETRYFHNNARVLAKLAIECAEKRDEVVVAILFRDADGTASSERGEWEAKRRSMLDGFEAEGFTHGVPMIPNPKSEAWLLCALKENPYQGCIALEDRSGNDNSPDSLKKELETLLAKLPPSESGSPRERLNSLVESGTVDFARITMPSFKAFREHLKRIIAPHAVEPA
ncbi:MAG: hypothetical protein P4L85_23230 [Paludisphaera borealis]|uniref:hypothetical protein n=1 Tax=Paludisphaera borealis TaxID=1387353 RepID=UPI002844FE8C|nr:hypothetical protein [Paludisphaera borealis]MDR3622283.1 hypothetical protein [Paludisphaera borealis]